MPLLAWRHVAAMLAAPVLLGTTIARAAPAFTLGGDGAFRNITAPGGALPGVDVSGALVQANGSSTTMAALALEAASAVPLAMAGQPNGWLKLDGNGLVPAASIPASALSGSDPVARAAAAAATAAAGAALPAAQVGKANGVAPLDANALVPIASLPASVTNPVDATARATAAAAMTAASAALPSSEADKANGFAQLDGNALVPLSLLPSSVTSPADATARSSASAAQSTANAAQSLAAAALPASSANKANGFAQLDGNALVPLSLLPSSVTSPADATARSSASAAQSTANAAQSLAAAAVPSSLANRANGWPELDANALVPTSVLPAAYTASTAIATSLLGQANGPAQLDSAGSLSANTVAAATSSVRRTLAQHFSDTINGADFGMACNGSTDDTAALKAAVAASIARPHGAELILPAGQCEIGGEIDVTTSTSLRFDGRGLGTSHLEFTGNTDGLVFTLSNGANLTVDDFTISKRSGTNPSGTVFAHRALVVQAALVNNGQASHTQAGQVILTRLDVYGASPGGQTDGWAVGIGVIDINFPDIIDNVVSQPGGPISAALSSPLSLQPYPTAFAPGVASDYLLQGLLEPAGFSNAGAQDYTLDGTVIGNAATGGIAALDLDGTQGGYIAANRFFANSYGIRSDSKASTVENITVVANFIQDTVDDVYLNGMQGAEIGSNMFWEFNSSTGMPLFVGVWLRNGSSNAVTGNSFELNGGNNPPGENGIYFTSDQTAGGFANFPSTVTANNIFNVHGVGIGNDATSSNLVVSSNSINLSNPSDSGVQDLSITASNPRGNNDYIGNLSPYPELKSDTNGSVFVRRSLTCGGPYDVCALSVVSNGTTTFATDASGNATVQSNLAVGGSVRAPRIASPFVTVGGVSGHQTVQADLWAYASGTVTMTIDGSVQNAANSLPGLPSMTSAGSLSISGRMVCAASVGIEAFKFVGLWVGSGNGVLSVKSFTAVEDDGQASPPSGWGMQGAVDTTNNLPLIQGTGLSATTDCTAQVAEIINQ